MSLEKRTHKLTFDQLGDLLQDAWERGYIDSGVQADIMKGLLPIGYLRDKLRLLIERSDEEGYLNVTQLPEESGAANEDSELSDGDAANDDSEDFRIAA